MTARPAWRYRTDPYEHQDTVFKRTRDEPAWGLFLDMGCGKSKILIDTTCWLYCEGRINGLFLIAPKGVYGTWTDETIGQLVTHLPLDVLARAKILKWRSNHATKKFQEELQDLLSTDQDDLAIFVMNAEALTSRPAVGAAVAFLKSRAVLMGVDEATLIKTPTAQVTQKVVALGRGARFRRVLTGTPVTNSPLDVYSLYEFLGPDILGFSSYFAFRNRYAILEKKPIGPLRPTRDLKPDGTPVYRRQEVTLVTGYQRQDELRERMERACVIMKKEDCLDLPEKVYETREVELSPRQRQLYDSMRLRSLAELDEVGLVTAPLALTKLLRLHQITLGFVSVEDEDGERKTHEIEPNGGPRAAELMNLLEEIGPDEKVLIWGNYTTNLRTIQKLIRSTYGVSHDGRSVVATYDGSTSQEEREEIVRRFQDPTDPLRYFIGHTRTGGFGLTLTQAAHVIYFSNSFSLETRLQSEDRAHRIGQKRSVTYFDIRCPGTIDDKIVKALRDKHDLANALTADGWRRFLAE